MWELDYKESWALKNWCFLTVVLEKTLESPLDCRKIQPVHPKGNRSWIFIGRTDAEAEDPMLWLPDAKNWLIWKDPHAGKDWRRVGQGDKRGWDGWMASPTQRTWVWVNSGSWWWIGRPGVLQSMGSQRVRHDWAIELNWTECVYMYMCLCMHTCVLVSLCVCMYTFECFHVCMHIYVCTCVSLCVHICACVYACVCVCMCDIYVCLSVCTSVCIHMHVCGVCVWDCVGGWEWRSGKLMFEAGLDGRECMNHSDTWGKSTPAESVKHRGAEGSWRIQKESPPRPRSTPLSWVTGTEAAPTFSRLSQHPLPRADLAPLCAPGEPSPYNYHPLPRAISCRLVNRTSFSSTHIMVCLKRCQRSQFSWTGTIDKRWSLQRVPAGPGPEKSKTRIQWWRNHLAKPAWTEGQTSGISRVDFLGDVINKMVGAQPDQLY